jgi:hypothetical protein
MKAPATRWQRWRRRLMWLAIAVVALRILLSLAMPWIIDLAASTLGLSVTYRSVSLSICGWAAMCSAFEPHSSPMP